ncbi:MAG: ABC transporter substrate-binding protein [Candidatus Rokubacteria bacterium]|nr:ABC transporter substrate-binding protein [Candidatus Rokubacteria bacterium]
MGERVNRWVRVLAPIAGWVVLLAAMPAEAQVKIRFQTWHWNETPWVKSLEEFQQTFNAANPGIQVVRDDSRYADKEAVFITQSQAKAAADIPHFSYRAIRHLADRGFLLDLTPFVDKEGGASFLAQWDPAALEMCKYQGKLYCLPDDLNPLVLMYNTVHFREAGLDPARPPTTWAEFLDYAKKLTRDTDGDGKIDRWGVGVIGARQEGLFMRFNPWLWGAGGDYLTPDAKRSALDTAEALEGFRWYVELFTKHKVVPPGAIEQGAQEVRTQLAHGKVSMIITLPAAMGIVQAINPKLNVREVMALAPVPVGKKKVTSAWFSMRVISTSTRNPEAAWRVYKTWHEKDQQMRNFRIAGVLSTRLDVKNSPEVKNDKFAQVFAAQTPFVKWEPLIAEWPKIGDAMITAVQEGLTGVKAPEQALRDANAATNRVLGH